jgi:hypothetical protein
LHQHQEHKISITENKKNIIGAGSKAYLNKSTNHGKTNSNIIPNKESINNLINMSKGSISEAVGVSKIVPANNPQKS